MQGTIPKPAPTTAASISLPTNGQTFSGDDNPITITGICETGLLVRVYRNGAFGGSVMCENNSFTLKMDLFYGDNELVARVFDDLDQEGPLSNKVNVTFTPPEGPGTVTGPAVPGRVPDRISLSSTFGRRGADPKKELTWPIILTGGTGPYAISVDWGDGKPAELLSQASTGQFTLKHTYDGAGTYKVIVKATDKNNEAAFLQLVAVVNGTQSSGTSNSNTTTVVRTKVMWQPTLVMFPLLLTSFWLGKRYQLRRVRYRMKNRIFPIDK